MPCHNEAGILEECIARAAQLEMVQEIILVDDGSTDGSSRLCATLHQRYGSKVQALLLPCNVGKNAAVRIGARTAVTDMVAVLDCDLTIAPESIEAALTQAIQAKAFVYGSRMTVAKNSQVMQISHRLGNRFFARWVSWLLRRPTTDALCGLKALPREVMNAIPQSSCRWGDLDLIFGAADSGLAFIEVPVEYLPRRAGKSKMRVIPTATLLALQCFRRMLKPPA
jgi:glycosyltransferase involved in cell wall biosynthesis